MTITERDLEARLRRDLTAVAATVSEIVPDREPASAPARRRTSRRRIGIFLGAAAVPVVLAAGAYLNQGPEYVDTIPPETIIVEGTLDGSRYLLVESRRTDECGDPVAGVELVEEDENLLGSEWNTVGETYGQPAADGCAPRTATYLADPALYNDGGTVVGDSYVWLWAVHPDVTAVRITLPDGSVEDLAVHRVDGAGYALYEVPHVASYTAELVIGDQVVPGSREEQRPQLP